MQNVVLSRAPSHFVRAKGEPCIDKIVHFYNPLMYMLIIGFAIDDMANRYSRPLATLLFLL
jgi:hypothetical protein